MIDATDEFPGSDLVRTGLADLAAGHVTESAMLVAMATPRLRALGFDIPDATEPVPSHRLYDLLSDAGPGAHSRYNALVARMVSFARAAERATSG